MLSKCGCAQKIGAYKPACGAACLGSESLKAFRVGAVQRAQCRYMYMSCTVTAVWILYNALARPGCISTSRCHSGDLLSSDTYHVQACISAKHAIGLLRVPQSRHEYMLTPHGAMFKEIIRYYDVCRRRSIERSLRQSLAGGQ